MHLIYRIKQWQLSVDTIRMILLKKAIYTEYKLEYEP